MPPHVGVYVVVAVGAVAVGLALKTFVYDPYIAPTIEQWREELLAREQERRRAGRRRAAPFSTFHRDSPKDSDALSATERSRNLDVEMESLRRGASATGIDAPSGEVRRRPTAVNSQDVVRDSYASSSDATRVPDISDVYASSRSSLASRDSHAPSTIRSHSSSHSSCRGLGVGHATRSSQIHAQQSSSSTLSSPPLPPLPPSTTLITNSSEPDTVQRQLLTSTSEGRQNPTLGQAPALGSRISIADTFRSAVSQQSQAHSQYPGQSSLLTVNQYGHGQDRDVLLAPPSSRSQQNVAAPTSFAYSRSFDAYTAPDAYESAVSSPRSELLSLYESDVGSSPFDRDEMMSPALRASRPLSHLDVPPGTTHEDLEGLDFEIGNLSTDSDRDGDNDFERRSATNFSTAASSISFGEEDMDVRSVSSAGLSEQSSQSHSHVGSVGQGQAIVISNEHGNEGRGSVSGMESDTLFEYHDDASDDGSYGSWEEVRGSERSLR